MLEISSPNPRSSWRIDDKMSTFITKDPFFARFSMGINKIPDHSIETIGVSLNKRGYYQMHYNPEWMSQWPEKILHGILKHEFWHIILEHVAGRRPEGEATVQRKWNIAADLAINSFLQGELPEKGCHPGKGIFEQFPPYWTSEKYYFSLPDIPQFMDPKIVMLDVHDGWCEGKDGIPNELVKIANARLKESLREIVKECEKSNSWGSVPDFLRKQIESMLSTFVDWRSVMQYFVRKTIRGERISTRKKYNRRYGIIHPGNRRNYYARIAVARDESGSVSDQFWSLLTGEMASLAHLVEFTVLPFDTQVLEENVFVWNRGEKVHEERVHCGGTDFNAPTNYVNDKGGFDGLIIMTDMEAPQPGPCNVPRLWITNESGFANHNLTENEQIIVIQ